MVPWNGVLSCFKDRYIQTQLDLKITEPPRTKSPNFPSNLETKEKNVYKPAIRNFQSVFDCVLSDDDGFKIDGSNSQIQVIESLL